MNTNSIPSPAQTPAEPSSGSAVSGMIMTASNTPAFSPLYQQIKTLILQSLQGGEWKPGDVIPSEQDLASRFKVSQGTVRKAIDELAADNLVVRRQGKGTFVATHAERHTQYRFLRLQPDIERDERVERTIVECKRLRSTADIARLLGLRSADTVVFVRRVLAFQGIPTILDDVWLPGTPFKGLTKEALGADQVPMYAFFESAFGVRMVSAEEKIKAVAASAEAAELLNLKEGHPLLSVERIAYTYNNVPMELRRGLYLTDAHHYKNELS